MRSVFTLIIFVALFTACSKPAVTDPDSQGNNIMDKEKVISEVLEAQDRLISLYKKGAFLDALAVDLDSENFLCIKNGKIETYDELAARYKKMVADGQVKQMDYQVNDQHFNVIDADNVLTTLLVKLTVTMNNGGTVVQDLGETILWQRIDGQWRLAHYHASEIPMEQ
jgi:hypothetical protein